jgi:hypothetical protein
MAHAHDGNVTASDAVCAPQIPADFGMMEGKIRNELRGYWREMMPPHAKSLISADPKMLKKPRGRAPSLTLPRFALADAHILVRRNDSP